MSAHNILEPNPKKFYNVPMKKDLTSGNVSKTMLRFAGPMILGNLLQQLYNIADTLIVGRALGSEALAAVGSTYSLFTFLTSIFIGLCMGSGTVIAFYYGKKEPDTLSRSMSASFWFISVLTLLINIFVFCQLDWILRILHVPSELTELMRQYVSIIACGLIFVFLYNYFAFLLRAFGNSFTPLLFLGCSSILNIALDLLFVMVFDFGVSGAAWATVISQMFSGIALLIYTLIKEPLFLKALIQRIPEKEHFIRIMRFSMATCIQQSVMNFGILMIQGLVNSFGTAVMAAFAAAVKIDAFAYMPAQEFGNAFSTFLSQNNGAGYQDRIRKGTKNAFLISMGFCAVVSLIIFLKAPQLMNFFVAPQNYEIIRVGVQYLRIEGSFYCLIGILFLLYAYYRGLNFPEMSIVLTIISLGTRVLLAYSVSRIPAIGVTGIWAAIPIGWFLADAFGILYMKKYS